MARKRRQSGQATDGADSPPVEDAGIGSPEEKADQSSRVVSLPRSNIFIYLTVFFVVINVILPWWGALASHILLIVFFVCILSCKRNPDSFPDWFVTIQKNFMTRLRENPPEILIVVGIVLLTIINNVFLGALQKETKFELVPRCRELLSVLLVLLAFVLNRRRQPYKFGRRSFWDSFKKESLSRVKVKKTVVEEPERERPPSSESQVLKADENRKLWEQRQKQRWEEWILEEVDRLNDDKGKK